MSTILYDGTTVESTRYDNLVATAVQAQRRSLGASVAQLARASGLPSRSIAAIELGGPTTRAQRYDIAVAFGWLANNRIAKGLATPAGTAPRV